MGHKHSKVSKSTAKDAKRRISSDSTKNRTKQATSDNVVSQVSTVPKSISSSTTTTSSITNNSNPSNSTTNFPETCRRRSNVENFVVVWLDSTIGQNDDSQRSVSQLQLIVNRIQTFTDSDACFAFIHKITHEKVFFIVSDTDGQLFVPCMSNFLQIDSIYVFCKKKPKHEFWAKQFPKVKGVFSDISTICYRLQSDTKLADKELTPMAILSLTNGMIPDDDINKLDPSFMYSQLLKEILVEMDYEDEAKDELVQFCRQQYLSDTKELSVIDEFDRLYTHQTPVWWYTRECFLYKILNKALRILDLEIIIKMGFFIRDLHRHLGQLHSRTLGMNTIILYRGQGMSNDEFQKLKKSSGGLLSFNVFLSTSSDKQISFFFARKALTNSAKGILFEMEIDSSISSFSFASLDGLSFYPSEKEILFDTHSVFRIGSVELLEGDLWQVRLKLTNDNDPQLCRLTEHMRDELQGPSDLNRLITLTTKLEAWEVTHDLWKKSVKAANFDLTEYIEQQRHQFESLIKNNMGDEEKIRAGVSEIIIAQCPPDQQRMMRVHSKIGTLQLKPQNVHDTLIKEIQQDLNMWLQEPEANYEQIASLQSDLGECLRFMGYLDKAMESYERTLQIELAYLPATHPSLATTHKNIGLVYSDQKKFADALAQNRRALAIQTESLPSNHEDLARTHISLASTYDALHKYKKAIQHCQKAVEIVKNCSIHHLQKQEYEKYLETLLHKIH